MEKEFAKEFWRGIANKDFVTDNQPNSNAFHFAENPERQDTYKELSINWNDKPESLDILLSQRKPTNNQIQFKAGVAKIELILLKQLFGEYILNKSFSYERDPLPNNEYHGNLLINKDMKKQNKAKIQNGLALFASQNDIIPNPNT